MIWLLLALMTLAAAFAVAKLLLSASPKRLGATLRFASGAAWTLGFVLTLAGKPLIGLPLLGLGAVGVGALALPGKRGRSAPAGRDRHSAAARGGPDVERDRDASGRRRGLGGPGVVTEQQAYQILGLKPGATAEEIVRAHRALMKKIHPDQGGTTELAARVNAAKDLLMRPRHR